MTVGETTFTRKDTAFVKGIALMLMIIHHCCAPYERLPLSVETIEAFKLAHITQTIGVFGQICVSMFFFLGGYGLYKRYSRNELSLLRDLKHLYSLYWKVLFVFVPIGFLFFRGVPTEYADKLFNIRFEHFHIDRFLWNLTAMQTDYNFEWWFITPYIFMLIYGYIFVNLQKSRNISLDLLLLLIITILFQGGTIVSAINPLTPLAQDKILGQMLHPDQRSSLFFVGILCARYNFLDLVKARLSRLNNYQLVILSLITIYACFRIRNTGTAGLAGEWIIVIFLSFALITFNRFALVSKTVCFIGKHSANMWLIHSFFCYYFLTVCLHVVFVFENTLIAALITLLLSLVSSILLNRFYVFLFSLFSHNAS